MKEQINAAENLDSILDRFSLSKQNLGSKHFLH